MANPIPTTSRCKSASLPDLNAGHGQIRSAFKPRSVDDFICLLCDKRMTSYADFEEYQHRTDNCGGLVEHRPQPTEPVCTDDNPNKCDDRMCLDPECPVHGPF